MQLRTRLTLISTCLLAPALALAQGGTQDKLAGVQLPSEEKAFIERLHFGNQTEVETARLAMEKAQTPAVRQFAQMLVTDHEKVDRQIMETAKANNMKLNTPKWTAKEKPLVEAQKATMSKLRALDGPAFEQSFLATMVERHDHHLAKVSKAKTQYKNSKFTTIYDGLVPALTQHRNQAYDLLGQVSMIQPGVGGAGQQGQMPHHEMGGSGMEERESGGMPQEQPTR